MTLVTQPLRYMIVNGKWIQLPMVADSADKLSYVLTSRYRIERLLVPRSLMEQIADTTFAVDATRVELRFGGQTLGHMYGFEVILWG